MDNATIQKAVRWAQSNVGETTSKQDVISHLQHSIMTKMAGVGGTIGGFGSGGT